MTTRSAAVARMTAYLALSGAGLIGTWYFNLRFAAGSGSSYLGGWFANPASSSVAVDVIVTALAACGFYVIEGSRLRMRWTWLLVPLTFLVALAFTFPLFLALRERALLRAGSGAETTVGRG